jgi:folylpolyglutamate synthase/dihydropteroate synthase
VALHRPDYVRAPKIQKPSVARVIVRAIRNGDPPGRFLRKDEKLGKWVDIGDKKAAEKTSQALREKPNEELGTHVVGTMLPNPDSYLAGTVLPAVVRHVTVVSGNVATTAESTKADSEEKTDDSGLAEV